LKKGRNLLAPALLSINEHARRGAAAPPGPCPVVLGAEVEVLGPLAVVVELRFIAYGTEAPPSLVAVHSWQAQGSPARAGSVHHGSVGGRARHLKTSGGLNAELFTSVVHRTIQS
jgi:hypothetical protein